MTEHIIEEEKFKNSRGSNRIWLDCSCGWFHATKNKQHTKQMKELHLKYPDGIPRELFSLIN